MASSSLLLLIVMVVAVTVHGYTHIADGTPAARFWEAALPGSPMPESIAKLVRKGIDHSPLTENHTAARFLPNAGPRFLDYGTKCAGPHPMSGHIVLAGLFFHEADMHRGGVMTLALPASDPAAFLPRDAADGIPFGNLTDTLARFGIALGSKEAARVGDTVCRCSAEPLAGERKACATSLEGVVVSAKGLLATSRPVSAWASTVPSSGLPRGEYVVQAVRPLGGGGGRHFVACHSNPYPYAVYGCHMPDGPSQAHLISIHGGGLPTVDMVAMCHLDTSNWNPAHPAFKILGTHPGGSPICHFMPYADMVFGER
ncbi:unnamed protein product [Alopecurus aequalis]